MTVAQTVLAFACCVQMLRAQTFEVAAIKPGETGDRVGNGVMVTPAGEFRAINLTVESLVRLAYGVKDYQVAGGANWVRSERFTIVAKGPGEKPITRTEYTPMLQVLLAERFHLNIRREMTDLPAYALTVDKGGPKMQVSGPDEKFAEASGATGNSPRVNGGGSVSELKYTGATMDAFVTRLGVHMRNRDATPLLNRTGLDGAYNFSLPYTSEMSSSPGAPSIFSAIKDLGLKLEKSKYPVETIVIESVERPVCD